MNDRDYSYAANELIEMIQRLSVWTRIERNPPLYDAVVTAARRVWEASRDPSMVSRITVEERRIGPDWSVVFVVECTECEHDKVQMLWRRISRAVQESSTGDVMTMRRIHTEVRSSRPVKEVS